MPTLLRLQNLIWGNVNCGGSVECGETGTQEKLEKVLPLIMQVLPGNLKEE